MIPLLAQPFLFMRHGQTDANAAGTIAGWTDCPLNDHGRAQARAAAALLRAEPIAAIWHSPLSRAAETAAIVADALGAPLHALDGLAERNWGAWEGQPRDTLIRDATPPDGEGPGTFRTRTRAALAAITGPFPVLIVAHSGTAREIHALIGTGPHRRAENACPVRWQPGTDCHWTCTELSHVA